MSIKLQHNLLTEGLSDSDKKAVSDIKKRSKSAEGVAEDISLKLDAFSKSIKATNSKLAKKAMDLSNELDEFSRGK